MPKMRPARSKTWGGEFIMVSSFSVRDFAGAREGSGSALACVVGIGRR